MNTALESAGLKEKSGIDKFCEELCPKMSIKQRIIGYLCCFGAGSFVSMISFANLKKFFDDPPETAPFVMIFICGNLIQLCSSLFLSGPVAYGKKLVSKEIRCAFFTYIFAMIGLLIAAHQPTYQEKTDDCSDNAKDCPLDPTELVCLVLGLVAITYICMIWFAICTIPFAKACLCKCVQGSCREWTDACKEYFGCKKKEPTMAEKVGLGGGKKPGSSKGFLGI
mmetsp:Transcript_33266/g.87973  ORF Transcript_33266/g.87973 Transcript_33266/m.87973 type:complete len:224 (-) Transcript_33266:448-1119(-)|eukprot:CAMPEP_0119501682 /NCGR_PEP_ID=MMETSP1344-20130328/23414_1 /TAXON_ID=236787 /ORGANISM="Florenciella parvula, Strain CCMP2471" /LENGTH=223 /DNA_ID=CAMNT_0007537847 /DNA_START=82 /DNA_END=753 /DNA_ORIENTATION=-